MKEIIIKSKDEFSKVMLRYISFMIKQYQEEKDYTTERIEKLKSLQDQQCTNNVS